MGKRKLVQCVQNENIGVSAKDTILAIKNAGFDGVFVQWYNDKSWEFGQKQQLDLCRELGLEIEFVHLGYKNLDRIWEEGSAGETIVKNFLKDMDEMRKNDVSLVVMHLTNNPVDRPPTMIGIKRFQKIVDYAEKLNIRIAFENTNLFGYLGFVFEHIKNKNIGICYDSGHCHCFYKDKFNWDKFKDKVFALHLHDNDQSKDLHLLPFDGDIDWKSLMKTLKNAGYDGVISLESCYRYQYLNESLEKFYKDSFKKAKKLAKFLK